MTNIGNSQLLNTVINVNVKSQRPIYGKNYNLRKWCENPNNVYIGRRGIILLPDAITGKKKRYPENDSIWANKFKLNKDGNREEIIEKYEKYIIEKIKEEPEKYDLNKLVNKTLGCWCKPEPCHGDILLKLIKENNFLNI